MLIFRGKSLRLLPIFAPIILSSLYSCKHVSTAGNSRISSSGPEACWAGDNWFFFENGSIKVEYYVPGGTANFLVDGQKRIKNFYAAVQLDRYVTSKLYKNRNCQKNGDEYTVTSTGDNLPTMKQVFILNGGNKFLTRLDVEGENLATNWIAPLVVDEPKALDLGSSKELRALWVPHDNDKWVSYNAAPIADDNTSNEVKAIYEEGSRHGIVVGSVTHDVWKTGVYHSQMTKLNAFGGQTSKDWTHDVLPHGKVSGKTIKSPTIFVGYSNDWRDLMEEYADSNLEFAKRLNWSGGVPFGWNSWGKIQENIDYDKAIKVSDFIKNRLQNSHFSSNNTVYINLDSYWDKLNDEQLRNFVAHAKKNGQKAGIYWAPFVDWGKNADSTVPGSDTKYSEIWLRDSKNQPIELDDAYAIDPTHPASKKRMDVFIDQFKAQGFEYIKLDFLTHGALESTRRYDSSVQTGIQAYNQGMQYIKDRIGGSMFISLSIAPIFPYQYAHARRVACDTYGAATGQSSSRYALNSASYGWWMSSRLYTYNDPDHMVFEGFNSSENVLRLLSGVVAGTVFLSGDDLTQSKGQDLASYLLTNPRLNELARMGKAFRPVQGNTGDGPSKVLVLHDNGRHFLAVFNFDRAENYAIDLERAGFDANRKYQTIDLFDGSEGSTQKTLKGPLAQNYGKIFELK
jgi:hypothetical protein